MGTHYERSAGTRGRGVKPCALLCVLAFLASDQALGERLKGEEGAVIQAAGFPRLDLPEGVELAVSDQLAGLWTLARRKFEESTSSATGRADVSGELGRHLHAYGLNTLAREWYELSMGLAPRDFRWPYLLAVLAEAEGQLEKAAAHYQRALAIVPGVSPALIRLAGVEARQGNVDRSEWLYREALRVDPTSSAAEAGLGELLAARERPQEAIALLESALEKEPRADRLYYPLALAYRKIGEEERARELLARSGKIGLKPADPLVDSLDGLKTGERIFLLKGQSAFRAAQYSEAARLFRKALEANPQSLAARIDLGSALGQAGEVDEATGVFERAVELAPGNATALYNLGVLYSQRGDPARAVDVLRQAGLLAPEDGGIRFELAEALRQAGRLQEALLHFDAAIGLQPGETPAWAGKAQALIDLEDFKAARTVLEQGLVQFPDSGLLASVLARLLATAPDPAVRDGARAFELALRTFESGGRLEDAEVVAEALAEAGRCDQAANWIAGIIEEARQTDQALAVLDRLLASQARFEGGAPCRWPVV